MTKPNTMKQKNPPKWALRFLQLFIKDHYLEQIEGDLYELFHREPSRFRFAWNTLRFFRLRYLKGLDDFEQLTTLAMIKNYLKVAIRTLLKQKSFSLINIGGLAVALASFMLISMFVLHERSYDNFMSDKIYRVANGENGRWTPTLLAPTAQAEVPQIAYTTKINGLGEGLFEVDNQTIKEPKGAWVGKNFLKVFDIDLLEGDSKTALTEPNQVVLTESVASKYFPNQSAMSKVISIDGDPCTVVGIVEDRPKNTHIPFGYLVSYPVDPEYKYFWSGNNTYTYARLKENSSEIDAELQLENLYATYVAPELIDYTGHDSFEDLKIEYPDRQFAFTLTPIKDIHLEKPYFSLGDRGNKENILIFSLVAIFILIIASVNYVNMSTAKSSARSKEVGIRKSLGSQKSHIISQFLTESTLITFLAMIISYLIAYLSLNIFNQVTQRDFDANDLFSISTILISIGLVLVVGLLAGSYPAYITSRFNAIQSLKGGIKQEGKSYLRNGLVVFQFATSIFLIAVTFMIFQQVKFLQQQDIGIETKQTLVIENGMQLEDKYEVFKKEIEKIPSVLKVSKMSHVPFKGVPDYTYSIPSQPGATVSPMNTFMAPGAEEIFGFNLLKGRFFKEDFVSDTASVIINEALANELGWADPIGKELNRNELIFKIIGVVSDFNYQSLRSEIDPMIIRYGNASMEIGKYHQRYVLVQMDTDSYQQSLGEIGDAWDEMVPKYPFEAEFLDDAFQKMFDSEKRFITIFTIFSSLAILIAFLGLFALTTFILQKRFKEIAVRKVMGATVPSLLKMIAKDFTWMVLIGGAIGLSGAFYWLQDWLNGYSYRLTLQWYHLAIPLIFILILTWIIVTSRSYIAATSNPANALKEE